MIFVGEGISFYNALKACAENKDCVKESDHLGSCAWDYQPRLL